MAAKSGLGNGHDVDGPPQRKREYKEQCPDLIRAQKGAWFLPLSITNLTFRFLINSRVTTWLGKPWPCLYYYQLIPTRCVHSVHSPVLTDAPTAFVKRTRPRYKPNGFSASAQLSLAASRIARPPPHSSPVHQGPEPRRIR
ncbi:hypothetical protein RirG_011120 [Rhizophagus irregularis DAOM 197198w]|uniref:Uncharacterized protein n=1 Tax=Rhizophagus irregularis (strain DAOM 197198w) TaxID=1432141 RepID=A0A015KGT1_RHIIW|nr:hypothetical protein RirG_011120 [Rhizophagus irregularis DAOM 197198w]